MTKNAHFETEFVKSHRKYAGEYLAVGVPERFAARLSEDLTFEKLESPIEVAFVVWWRAFEALLGSVGLHRRLDLFPQRDVILGTRIFRLDFQVVSADQSFRDDAQRFGIREPRIAVELDGHEFHERTKDQVALRNERDRLLMLAGWKVFHFSGTELNQRQVACITDVYVEANAMFSEWKSAVTAAQHPDDPILNPGRK